MKSPLASKIAHSLNESLSNTESDGFETITLRPSEEVSAMIVALNQLYHLPVATLFLDDIAVKLCELLLDSKNNQSIIEELLDAPPQSGSALGLLIKQGAIREWFPDIKFEG